MRDLDIGTILLWRKSLWGPPQCNDASSFRITTIRLVFIDAIHHKTESKFFGLCELTWSLKEEVSFFIRDQVNIEANI